MLRNNENLDFKEYENIYGSMYHLLLDKLDDVIGVKFVSDCNFPKFATKFNNPVFFDFDKNFRLALEYTIIYPKIYVRRSVQLEKKHLPLERSYIH